MLTCVTGFWFTLFTMQIFEKHLTNSWLSNVANKFITNINCKVPWRTKIMQPNSLYALLFIIENVIRYHPSIGLSKIYQAVTIKRIVLLLPKKILFKFFIPPAQIRWNNMLDLYITSKPKNCCVVVFVQYSSYWILVGTLNEN